MRHGPATQARFSDGNLAAGRVGDVSARFLQLHPDRFQWLCAFQVFHLMRRANRQKQD
jgi:hypothetical protein